MSARDTPVSKHSPSTLGRGIAVLWAVAMLLLVPTAAHAQQGQLFGVTLDAQMTSLTAVDGACVSETVTVTNTGQSPIPPQHTIAFSAEGPGPGWTLQQGPPESVALAPGDTSTFLVELCPGEAVEDGDSVTYGITATVSDDPSGTPASNSISFTATLSDDRLFGVDVPIGTLWIALVAVAALLAVVLFTRTRSGGGVSISCPEASKTVAPGRGTSFPVRIRNDGRSKDVVSLSTSPAPPGWDTFLPLVDIPLEAREEQTVWLSVKSPDDAEGGDHLMVKVTARSSSTSGESATIDTLTTVKDATPPPAAAGDDDDASVYEPEQTEEEDLDVADEKPVAVKRKKRAS